MSDDRPSSEDLRRLFASLSEDAAPRADCPAPEAIWSALRGEGTPDEAAAVVAHTAECFACAEAWRLGHELAGRPIAVAEAGDAAQGAGAGGPASARAAARWTRGRRLGIGLAAAAVVLVVGGIGLRMLRPGATEETTREGEDGVIRSLLAENAVLPRGSCTLKWTAPAPGTRYTLRVGMEDLSSLAYATDLATPEYTIPAKDLEKLRSGSVIFWRIEASLPDGRRIDSPAFKNLVE